MSQRRGFVGRLLFIAVATVLLTAPATLAVQHKLHLENATLLISGDGLAEDKKCTFNHVLDYENYDDGILLKTEDILSLLFKVKNAAYNAVPEMKGEILLSLSLQNKKDGVWESPVQAIYTVQGYEIGEITGSVPSRTNKFVISFENGVLSFKFEAKTDEQLKAEIQKTNGRMNKLDGQIQSLFETTLLLERDARRTQLKEDVQFEAVPDMTKTDEQLKFEAKSNEQLVEEIQKTNVQMAELEGKIQLLFETGVLIERTSKISKAELQERHFQYLQGLVVEQKDRMNKLDKQMEALFTAILGDSAKERINRFESRVAEETERIKRFNEDVQFVKYFEENAD